MLRPILLALLLGVVFVSTQELFYEPFIVPRLAGWHQVPLLWWVAAFAPEIGVCVVAAVLARRAREWLVFCVLGAFVVTSVQWLLGLLDEPGHLKAVEGGTVHFGLRFLVLSVLLFGCVGTARLVRFGMRSYAAAV
jgi:hypothetical protein